MLSNKACRRGRYTILSRNSARRAHLYKVAVVLANKTVFFSKNEENKTTPKH